MSHEKINYLELPSSDLSATKAFFSQVFDWDFTDYGPEYVAFGPSAGLDGGFYLSESNSHTDQGAALIVFYSSDLAVTQEKIQAAGGKINQATFEFPGGRRFHFIDPTGNEFAVWSDK